MPYTNNRFLRGAMAAAALAAICAGVQLTFASAASAPRSSTT